jgi:hypothetical protein
MPPATQPKNLDAYLFVNYFILVKGKNFWVGIIKLSLKLMLLQPSIQEVYVQGHVLHFHQRQGKCFF